MSYFPDVRNRILAEATNSIDSAFTIAACADGLIIGVASSGEFSAGKYATLLLGMIKVIDAQLRQILDQVDEEDRDMFLADFQVATLEIFFDKRLTDAEQSDRLDFDDD